MSSIDRAFHSHREPSAGPETTSKQPAASAVDGRLIKALKIVQSRFAPVWPLEDYVAVNPWLGFADMKFLETRSLLRSVSDSEMLLPFEHYQGLYQAGQLNKACIDLAIDELVADGVDGAERLNVNQIVLALEHASSRSPDSSTTVERIHRLPTISATVDGMLATDWTQHILDELTKHCAAHYDRGQALWASPHQGSSLYSAWQSVAGQDCNFEILGIDHFRRFVRELPNEPVAAIHSLLRRLEVPDYAWERWLMVQAFAVSGWAAWTRYQDRQFASETKIGSDFFGLLAMRLAYETALSEHENIQIDWRTFEQTRIALDLLAEGASEEALVRLALLRATEIAYRNSLIGQLDQPTETTSQARNVEPRQLAQFVFCIDVRSERVRRYLEESSDAIKTYGFAGFFGIPCSYVAFGENRGTPQVPVLIQPRFQVNEALCHPSGDSDSPQAQQLKQDRRLLGTCRHLWKEAQSSITCMFSIVESTGWLHAYSLFKKAFAYRPKKAMLVDTSNHDAAHRFKPSLSTLEQQGVSFEDQVTMAESMLRGIGLLHSFARLVVFCGHGSQTENNPMQASLDCGACGGHSGEPNARLAAELLNQKSIREALVERGISIPEDTWFIAAKHNTTTDAIDFFETSLLPASHQPDWLALKPRVDEASMRSRIERLASLASPSTQQLCGRAYDWSEVRNEWGLAGNAAFIAAPRKLTQGHALGGRVFLHSYDQELDPAGEVLEQIMTAPMIVAHWINMQYYASSVDPVGYGNGTKTVHNVVGRFGILSGNGGDLKTGLPWQSIHDGSRLFHEPLRLVAIIAAKRESIQAVLAKHPSVAQLLSGGWLQLLAYEEDRYYRFQGQGGWEEVGMNSRSQESHPSPANLR